MRAVSSAVRFGEPTTGRSSSRIRATGVGVTPRSSYPAGRGTGALASGPNEQPGQWTSPKYTVPVVPNDSCSIALAASPSHAEWTKLPFTGPAGEPYRFVGIKHVAQDPGLDAWADTTTLYSTIYRGDSDVRDIVGSGVLHLRIPDLARQMTTFRIIRSRDPITYALALLGFGRYFAGSLWDTYVKRH